MLVRCAAEALTCVSMMAKAIGPPLVGYMHDLLDPMFSAGLSRTLIDALTEVRVIILFFCLLPPMSSC